MLIGVRLFTTITARGDDIRVGEALTNARKSSAAWRDGLVAMVRLRREQVQVGGDTAGNDVVERCSSVTREARGNSIRIGRGVLSTRPSRRCGVSLSCHCQPWRRPCGPLWLSSIRAGEPRPHWTSPSQRVVKNIKTAHAQTWQARRDRTCPRAPRDDPHLTARPKFVPAPPFVRPHHSAFTSRTPASVHCSPSLPLLAYHARRLSLPPSCLRRRLAFKLRPATTTRPPPTPPRPLRANHHYSCRRNISMRTDIQ